VGRARGGRERETREKRETRRERSTTTTAGHGKLQMGTDGGVLTGAPTEARVCSLFLLLGWFWGRGKGRNAEGNGASGWQETRPKGNVRAAVRLRKRNGTKDRVAERGSLQLPGRMLLLEVRRVWYRRPGGCEWRERNGTNRIGDGCGWNPECGTLAPCDE
jgi:hypothetical protein